MLGKLIKREEHCIRFFNTTWSSRLSLLRWNRKDHKEYGMKFREGYAELMFGRWKLRYRNKK